MRLFGGKGGEREGDGWRGACIGEAGSLLGL